MQFPLSVAKVLKTEFERFLFEEEWCTLLLQGNFYKFEQLLHQALFGLYDSICEELISFVSMTKEFVKVQKEKARAIGLQKLVHRTANVRLRTGTRINYLSF